MDRSDPELGNAGLSKGTLIQNCFHLHGARPVETSNLQVDGCQNLYGSSCFGRIVPLKNGEEDKEQVCLRFDHTVPLAKMVESGKLQHSTKVYQMGPVFRRSPEGKCVEEYKCDMDILGSHDPMIPDSECIKVIFSAISICGISTQNVKIRISHCRLLSGIMTHCGVPDRLRPVVRSMLVSPCTVIAESLVEVGLSREVAASLESYLVQRGGSELLAKLKHNVRLMENQDVQKGIEDLELLFQYCQTLRVPTEVLTLDISFVREFDYYTGVVFEALLLDEDNEPYKCLACGGRYDNLIGNLQGGGVPAVGFSINVDPICKVLSTVDEFSKDFLQDPEESTDESLPAPEESTDKGLKGHASLETGIRGEGKQTEQEGTGQMMVAVPPPPCQDLQHKSTEERSALYSDVEVESSLPLREEGPYQPAERVFGLSHHGPPTPKEEKNELVIMSVTPGKTIKYPVDPESLLVLQN